MKIILPLQSKMYGLRVLLWMTRNKIDRFVLLSQYCTDGIPWTVALGHFNKFSEMEDICVN